MTLYLLFFVRSKKDGHHRLILNLKDMNQYIEYHHFKMDTLQTAISTIRPSHILPQLT